MVMNLESIRQRRNEIERLAEMHGAQNIRVFGSVARGTAGENSDLDILARFEAGRSLLDLIGFQQDLEEMLGCKVDVISEGGISPYLQDEILNGAIPI